MSASSCPPGGLTVFVRACSARDIQLLGQSWALQGFTATGVTPVASVTFEPSALHDVRVCLPGGLEDPITRVRLQVSTVTLPPSIIATSNTVALAAYPGPDAHLDFVFRLHAHSHRPHCVLDLEPAAALLGGATLRILQPGQGCPGDCLPRPCPCRCREKRHKRKRCHRRCDERDRCHDPCAHFHAWI